MFRLPTGLVFTSCPIMVKRSDIVPCGAPPGLSSRLAGTAYTNPITDREEARSEDGGLEPAARAQTSIIPHRNVVPNGQRPSCCGSFALIAVGTSYDSNPTATLTGLNEARSELNEDWFRQGTPRVVG